MWLDTTSRSTTEPYYSYYYSYWTSTNERDTVTSRETEVTGSPPWNAYVSINGQPTTASGESPNLVTDDPNPYYVDTTAKNYYYEPFIGAKLSMTKMASLANKNYVVCTDGNNNFKRLGTGDRIGADGLTIGDAFHPLSTMTTHRSTEFAEMKAEYPYNISPALVTAAKWLKEKSCR